MSDALVPGLLVTPSIRLSRKLGRGGMGSVWIADHLRLQTQVVVKFMADEHLTNPEVVARFEREAALGAQAKSPHVVQIFDHGISSIGLPYIAMELLEGEDLGSFLAREGKVSPPVWAGWMAQACRGLFRAHARGIIHRDIKPENIFLCDNEGEVLVKVLDFGIAKGSMASGNFSATATGAVLGTPYYMSPEQTMGSREIDHRTDLWSLGVVAYYALTGVRPFEHEALGAIVAAITTAPIAPPSLHHPALGPAVDAWMERALARDPKQRFGSAKEMAEAFSAAVGRNSAPPLESSGVGPWPSAPPAPPGPPMSTVAPSALTFAARRSHVKRWGAAGVGAAVVALGFAASPCFVHRNGPARHDARGHARFRDRGAELTAAGCAPARRRISRSLSRQSDRHSGVVGDHHRAVLADAGPTWRGRSRPFRGDPGVSSHNGP